MASAAAAQAPEPDTAAPERRLARAVRLAGTPPHVDGRMSEAVWGQAEPITDFVMKEPVEGAAPTDRMEVRLLYDAEYLYVGARMHAADPAAIQRSVGRRDASPGSSEHVWISLDTYFDHRTAYSFGVTASGERFDWYHARDSEHAIDLSYDPVWDGDAVVDSLGWTAEMRIPFAQLRFTAADEQVWGLNIDRWIPSRNEDVFWIPVPRNVTAWSSRMGELHGITGIRPTRRLEVLPYVAGNATVASTADPANPFDPDGRTGTVRVGGDVKMGLGPSLTLQASVNPDFGQVEGDPAVVNLSAFEVFFGERRPFFTEGSQLFQSRGPGYFYSRRIGAAPPGGLRADYVDRPAFTTILGAAKLTGRTASGLSVGVLSALTGRAYGRGHDIASGRRADTLIAPVATYGVARVQQEFGASQSTVGLMLTGVRRDLPAGSSLAGLLPSDAVTGGMDWDLRWADGAYDVGGWLGFSHVRGDSLAVQGLQRSSRRYYQRPDQSYVRYDPAATALSGYTAGLSASRNNGRHWLWDVSGSFESPGLELNDAGRISTADGLNARTALTYRETTPGSWYRSYQVRLENAGEWNFGGERQFSTTRLDASVTLHNQWSGHLTAWVDHAAHNARQTRGGPTMATPRAWVTIAQVSNNFAAPTRWNARVYYGRDGFGELTYRISGGLTLRPGARWVLSASPNYLYSRDPRQYVTTVADPLAATTYGARYVFATAVDREWTVPLRFNYTVTPDLTIELYAQPFIASVRYSRYGELAAPGSGALRRYGEVAGTSITADSAGGFQVRDGAGAFALDNGDFHVASLHSNLVLRWEWRRGSTVYLVWQQDRGANDPGASSVRLGGLFDGLRGRGDNFFAIKVSYWLSGR